ncbi:hypothetical protein [Aurantivibrio infirmus]
MATDWQLIFYREEGKLISSLEFLCNKRFPSDINLAEEAFNHVMAQLSDNNFEKLQRFRGDSKPTTYVISCFRNGVEDFARRKFGRCVAPDWLKKIGGIYTSIHRRLCCEHRSSKSIQEEFANPTEENKQKIEEIVAQIFRRIPDCLHKTAPSPQYDEFSEHDMSDPLETEEKSADVELGSEGLISAIWLFISNDASEVVDPEIIQRLEKLRGKALPNLTLSDDQKLLLRMVVIDEKSVTDAANLLKLKYHTARRQLESALTTLKDAFSAGGFDGDDLL